MQNRYTADVGDFGKHGLLRFLNGATDPEEGRRFRLGVLWYLTHDQTHTRGRATNGDGQHTGYLMRTRLERKDEYRDCDADLWEGLRDLVLRDARCVHCVQEEAVLPADTLYYANILEYAREARGPARRAARELWWESAMAATAAADLVMMDPDNGMGPDEKMYQADGPKFLYLSDMQAVWEAGKSLVTYQHIHRIGDAADQIHARVDTIQGVLEGADPIPLLFHRGTARVFFVIPRPEHPELRDRAARFAGGLWADHGHFEWVP